MARTKLIVSGSNPEEKLISIISQCANKNQICQHIKRYDDIINFLKSRIKSNSDKSPMEFLYLYQENIEVPLCICGKERKYHCQLYRESCGDKSCIDKIRENSKIEFCRNNYGVDFVTQLDSMKNKSKETCLSKYGVDNITKSREIILRRKERNLENWGVEDPISLKIVRGSDSTRGLIKIQSSLPKGYTILKSDHYFTYTLKCPKGHEFQIGKGNMGVKKKNGIEICNQCNEYVGSMVEQEVFNYIQSLYPHNISRSNRKLIAPFEIDMVLDDIKLCIEFNGDYWHSTKIVEDQYYHLNKLNMCLIKGYKLLQIRENDWYNQKDLVKSRLKSMILGDPFITDEKKIELDLSWYDDRFRNHGNWKLIERKLPTLIKVGQYNQWNSGTEIYELV